MEQHQRRRTTNWSSWGSRATLSPRLSRKSRSLAHSVEEHLEDGGRRSEVDPTEDPSYGDDHEEGDNIPFLMM